MNHLEEYIKTLEEIYQYKIDYDELQEEHPILDKLCERLGELFINLNEIEQRIIKDYDLIFKLRYGDIEEILELPCISCNKIVQTEGIRPCKDKWTLSTVHSGIWCESTGGWASAVFDPNGVEIKEELFFVLCDECILAKKQYFMHAKNKILHKGLKR